MNIRSIFKRIAPPILTDMLISISFRNQFSGNFRTWEDAKRASTGYDSDVILNKVNHALLEVKNGKAVYERDSVLFDKIEYSWPLLAALLWIASKNHNRLNLVDFGGSLGSSYFQNRSFLSHLDELTWNIIEQKKFAELGKTNFENKNLRFYYQLDDCLKEQKSDTILLSSVIQYIEKPYELLNTITQRKFRYVIFDRSPFLMNGDDRITIQKVPAAIYRATYPCWFLNQEKFLDFFSSTYKLTADFESNDRAEIPATFKGFIFTLRDDV